MAVKSPRYVAPTYVIQCYFCDEIGWGDLDETPKYRDAQALYREHEVIEMGDMRLIERLPTGEERVLMEESANARASYDKLLVKPSHDGIYPRCVWCRGENYALAVIAYSRGEIPCASTTNCGRYLPADYIKEAK